MATTTTPNYEIDYNDERLTSVTAEQNQALTENEQLYGGMIDQVDGQYQGLIDSSKEWADKQTELQNQQTDFAIQQIEQQKAQTYKDYVKEQSGAYVDWQKQSNQYGANAEQMAASGLTNTGYSESSQVSMYNTYQNRVMTARESYQQAVQNYNNSITEARLQNNSILAEIAYQAQQEQLQLALDAFQYKNNLILESADKKLQIKQMYHQQWMDVLNQMNTENALAEDVRQFNENIAFQEKENALDRQHDLNIQRINQEFEEKMAEINQGYELALINARTAAEKELIEEQHKKDMEKLAQQHANALALADKELENEKALWDHKNKSDSGGGGVNEKPATAVQNLGNKVSSFITGNSNKQNNNAPFDGATINQDSVMALGYGPLSATKLASMVASGKISYSIKKGQVYFRSNGTLAAGQAALNKYTWLK